MKEKIKMEDKKNRDIYKKNLIKLMKFIKKMEENDNRDIRKPS